MAYTTLIFIKPFHANFDSKVHPVAYHKRTEAVVYLYSLPTLALDGMGDQRHTPTDLPAGKRPGTQCTLRLGGPQGKFARLRKISLPPGFDPQTVQPVQIRYTDCAIPAYHATSYY